MLTTVVRCHRHHGELVRSQCCGATAQDDDGVAIGAAKASSTSRDGRCMRQEVVLHGTATAPSTARRRGDWRCEGVIHDDEMVHGNWGRDGVHNGKWLRRCDGVDKWLRVIRIGDWGIKIKGENVSFNLDACICIFSLLLSCM